VAEIFAFTDPLRGIPVAFAPLATPATKAQFLLGAGAVRITALDALAGMQVFARRMPVPLTASGASQSVLAVVPVVSGTLTVGQRIVSSGRSTRLASPKLRVTAGTATMIGVRLSSTARTRLRRTSRARLELAFVLDAAGNRYADRVTVDVKRP
jgi:hypothetical protein